jgi:secreted trypsin-like serine protease
MASVSLSRCASFTLGLCLGGILFADAALAQDVAKELEGPIVGATPFDDTMNKITKNVVPKIFNGARAVEGAYPWQVALIVSPVKDPLQGFFCSGAIYNETWIVTAAHCLVRKDPTNPLSTKLITLTPDQVRIVYGVNALQQSLPQQESSKIVLHDAFNPKTFDSDIALIQLANPIAFGQQTKSIPIAGLAQEANILREGAQLTVTGWGATSPAAEHAGLPVRTLLDGEVQFVPNNVCSRSLSGSTITSNMICTFSRAVDVCSGDSGGPIVPYRSGPDAVLLGVVSGNWVGDCGNNDYQRHTRVVSFDDWIKKCTATAGSCQ